MANGKKKSWEEYAAEESAYAMEELNQARKELEKGQIDKAVTQKQFKVV